MVDQPFSVDTANATKIGDIAEISVASGLRFHQVLDDHLDPTIRPRDYVLLAPVSGWAGEGYYLVENPVGDPTSYSCSVAGSGETPIKLDCHNRHYSSRQIGLDEFESIVLGKVAMICSVVDHKLIEHAQRREANR